MSDAWTPPDAPREVVDRCAVCGSPMRLELRDTLVIERCEHGHHVQHVQLVYADGWDRP